MTTTNDKTPDPTPALLSAARLTEIREWAQTAKHDMRKRSLQLVLDVAALLAHLDALTAPVPDDGGEAMVLAVFAEQQEFGAEEAAESWAALSPASRAENVRIALALDAHGYARGFAAGADLANETTRHLIEARDLAQRTAEAAHAEIARLTAELAATKEDRR